MIELWLLPLALQISDPAGEFYEPNISQEAAAATQSVEAEEINTAEYLARLNKLGDEGDDTALSLLGELYSLGLQGVTPDPARACDYFERVSSERAETLHNVATCYFDGRGRPRDLERAREFYEKAANAGFRQSYCAYGNMLVRGLGGDEEPEEGVRLCRIAAAAGDANAQTDYGGYLLMGIGTERDPVLARFVLEQAEVQEQANATFLLAQIHEKGDGIEQSNAVAAELYKKAYQRGRVDAAIRAGLMLARIGFRMEGDEMFINTEVMEEAVLWLEVAAEVDPDPENRDRAAELIENSRVLIESAGR